LLTRHPRLSLRDQVTIMYDKPTVSAALARALDVPEDDARTCLSLMTLTPENRDEMTNIVGGPRPPYIETGTDYLVQSLAGTLDCPFEFMLREARRRFAGDWDRQVASRETYFRQELTDVMMMDHLLWSLRSRPIKRGRSLTDIDAACLHPPTRTLGLFQLKWQDPFGHDMRERDSRRRNFVKHANRWVEVVFEWLRQEPREGVADTLGIPRGKAHLVQQVHLFVIGRHFAHFSHPTEHCDLDERAAWGNWGQVVRLVSTATTAFVADPIRELDSSLRGERACDRMTLTTPRREFALGRLRVVVEGETITRTPAT
jgi:hypothetical protein